MWGDDPGCCAIIIWHVGNYCGGADNNLASNLHWLVRRAVGRISYVLDYNNWWRHRWRHFGRNRVSWIANGNSFLLGVVCYDRRLLAELDDPAWSPMMRITIAFVAMLITSFAAWGQEYRTQEFRSGDSHIVMAYSCGVLGVKTGVAPDAMTVVATVMAQGVTSQHSGDLMTDALDWWAAEGEQMAAIGMWEQFCQQPIDNLRRLVAP